ncbi:hypothetical protein [Chryseobacterium polytrichastri]|uniref:Outer membrane protein beta-barrel domain-containing protein n=1 Tax=Chryseobacterium polytrichastri TaxID=1302687 RepID=A0A1M7CI86_9FLAO|nr:hypothetical protein [Chryseobacterium polytrichastri]SHL66883.1 hypothetical protein SAMN05444267_102236 [Chryseobacterium polytrichastri]
MKKLLLLGAFALLGGAAQAQEGFRLGGHVGAPLGDASDAASVTIGVDAAYMWNITKGLDIGVTTGYSHFFGKDHVDDFGFIPIAASGKYKFAKIPLFVGLDLGAAISTKDYINSGLYIAPRVGYQMKRTELYLGFQNISSKYKNHDHYWFGDDKFNFGAVNFGVNFFLK